MMVFPTVTASGDRSGQVGAFPGVPIVAGAGLSATAIPVAATWGMVAVTGALLLSGQSVLLTLAFPAMAVAVGALQLWLAPARLVPFVLWLWMLSPFIRRVVDAHNGWNPQNPILLAPILVCMLLALDAVRHAPRLRQASALPFVGAFAALVGGIVVGLFVSPPALVVYAGLNWMAPVLIGLYVALHPEYRDEQHRGIVRALVVGLVLIGVYGIVQFVSPPIWDRLWMINSRMDSIGTPEALRVRVFSTMNAPGPLAQYLSGALLILLAQRTALKWPAVFAGVVALLLSLARSAWLGFAIGALLLVIFASWRGRRAVLGLAAISTTLILALATVPLPTALESMRHTIGLRLTTMGDLSMDDSFRARQYLVPAVLAEIGEEPLGSGLGATLVGGARGQASSRLADQGLYLDNGILEVFLVLGWFGGLLFLASAATSVLLALRAVMRRRSRVGYLAGSVALLAQVVGGTIFAGVGGAVFWMAAAMAGSAGDES